jgi:hypothetical protein
MSAYCKVTSGCYLISYNVWDDLSFCGRGVDDSSLCRVSSVSLWFVTFVLSRFEFPSAYNVCEFPWTEDLGPMTLEYDVVLYNVVEMVGCRFRWSLPPQFITQIQTV